MNKYKTPALIFNVDELERKVTWTKSWASLQGINLSYSLKAQSLHRPLQILSPHLDGWSVSSLFEFKWAQEHLNPGQKIFWNSPWVNFADLAPGQATENLYFGLNSLNQWKNAPPGPYSLGLRLHIEQAQDCDFRYNPSKSNTHLGVPIDEFLSWYEQNPKLRTSLQGLAFHVFCELMDLAVAAEFIDKLTEKLVGVLDNIKWLNLGGGLVLEEGQNREKLEQSLKNLKKKFNGQILIEPGYDLVEGAFCLKTQVVDLLDTKAILDTSINHFPEFAQFQEFPEIKEQVPCGKHSYELFGCSCLVSDSFGELKLNHPLSIGDELTFLYTGAYSLVKANRFNGINFPTVYEYSSAKGFRLVKEYSYQNFRDLYF